MAHAADGHAPGDLIAEDEGYERIARGILETVERGPEG